MLDTTNRNETLENIESMDAVETDTVETFELEELPTNGGWLLSAPIARYFAFLVGGGLTTLGVVSLIASLTGHDTLFNIFSVNNATGLLYLLTGAAGLAVARVRGSLSDAIATAYTVAIMLVYITLFSTDNIDYGNAEGMPITGANHTLVILHAIRIENLPQFMANGMQVTLAMAALIVAGTIALQYGAQATERRGRRIIREYRSHTRLRNAA